MRGVIFGLVVFIVAQIVLGLLDKLMGGSAPMAGNAALITVGSIIGHIIFGITVALLVKEERPS